MFFPSVNGVFSYTVLLSSTEKEQDIFKQKGSGVSGRSTAIMIGLSSLRFFPYVAVQYLVQLFLPV